MKIRIIALALISVMILGLTACSERKGDMDMAHGNEADYYDYLPERQGEPSEEGNVPAENGLIENPFVKTSKEATSTFSADVDTASYALFRKLVSSGYNLSELKSTAGNCIRVEEMVNYFKYNYGGPENGELFGVRATIAPCPWNSDNALLVLGLKTEEAKVRSNNNLVFLIDVSGSMTSEDKLPLLKKAFSYLVSQLDEKDTVSIVTYSGKEEVVLDGCAGNKNDMIMKAVNKLEASGSTNGEAGLKMAYQLAEKHFISDGNNRIILASDGDLNVGISSRDELIDFIQKRRDAGTFLSVLGFGTGNYRDSNMEALADNGNGVYYYIDSEFEAEKIFGGELFSTLYTVAKDTKLQITFNPDAVDEYRLIGYENRMMSSEDFRNDTKDAGEIGAGHSVTVVYELKLTENAFRINGYFAELAIRYKRPGEEKANENSYHIGASDFTDTPNGDFRFAAAVAGTGMIIRNSKYKGDLKLSDIIETLNSLDLSGDIYRSQFKELVAKLRTAG